MTSVSVLFERPVDAETVAKAFHGRSRVPGVATENRAVEFRPAALEGRASRCGVVTVDGLRAEVLILGAPLEREAIDEAARHSAWSAAAEVAGRLASLVRIVATGPEGGPALPQLEAVTRAAAALLALPGALALFDEEGHALNSADDAARRLEGLRAGVPPLDLWVSLRRFQLADAQGWFLDTLGMGQLGLPDLEAYAGDAADDVAAWLRNVSLYLVQHSGVAGPALAGGNTLDGPDEEPWITVADGATVEPPRPVLRFMPLGAMER